MVGGAEAVFRAVASGIRAQWVRRAPDWPALFEALADAPRCLTGLMKMRAAARTDEARRLYEEFEAELCRGLGTSRVSWPEAFGSFASRPPQAAESVRALPRIAPEQALMLLGPLSRIDSASADLYAAALQTSLGLDATWPVPDETMLRLLGSHVPAHWDHHWSRGFGLEPPTVFSSAAEDGVRDGLLLLADGKPMLTDVLGARGTVEVAFTHATVQMGARLDHARAPARAA